MLRLLVAGAALALVSGTVAAKGPIDPAEILTRNAALNAPLPPEQAAMKSHVMFLASDELRGREAGSTEFGIAAQYVASQFYQAGLKPMGDQGSYLQAVPLVSYKPADAGSMAWAPTRGAPVQLAPGQDFAAIGDPSKAVTNVSAPVVFVGFGIVAPQFKRDDYKGVDVRGKIVAYFPGAPVRYPGEERAHFGSPATKLAIAAAHGAIGALVLEGGGAGRGSFVGQAASASRVRVTWGYPDGTGEPPAPGTPALALVSSAGAAKLFARAKTVWDKVSAQSMNDEAVFKPEQLPGTLSVTLRTTNTRVMSANVVGMLPGSDPVLKDQVVVLSGHLDHIGVGTPDAKGDRVNNGALDDAVGIASLIEEARRFQASGKPPRRSILFLAVTAEEMGLIGSDYFAHNPTVPKAKLVADVNLDMPMITYRFEDVIAFGADRSTLGPIVHGVARDLGLAFSPDPMPSEGLFVRSDHYRFVQQGIPSVFLWPGQMGPGKAAVERFMSEHYHQPSDELVQDPPIDWEQGVRFVDVNYRIARAIADGDQRPAWNRGDFFGVLYHGFGAGQVVAQQ